MNTLYRFLNKLKTLKFQKICLIATHRVATALPDWECGVHKCRMVMTSCHDDVTCSMAQRPTDDKRKIALQEHLTGEEKQCVKYALQYF